MGLASPAAGRACFLDPLLRPWVFEVVRVAVLSAEVLLGRSSWDLGWNTPVPLLILRGYAVPGSGMGEQQRAEK